MTQRTGGCLCGAVRFEADEPLQDRVSCHCSKCRRQTTQAFSVAHVPDDRFRLTSQDGLAWYASSAAARRGFCKRCGSLLFYRDQGSERISISLGAFDEDPGGAIEAHIFVDDKPGWYRIGGDAPRYHRGRSEPPIVSDND